MEIKFPSPLPGRGRRGGRISLIRKPSLPARFWTGCRTDLARRHWLTVPGVIVEHKGLTLTVHYRAVPERLGRRGGGCGDGDSRATLTLRAAGCGLPGARWSWRCVPPLPGTRERPSRKSTVIAAKSGIRRDGPFPVYFGDDRTDEDGFRVQCRIWAGWRCSWESRVKARWRCTNSTPPNEVSETMRLILEEL